MKFFLNYNVLAGRYTLYVDKGKKMFYINNLTRKDIIKLDNLFKSVLYEDKN